MRRWVRMLATMPLLLCGLAPRGQGTHLYLGWDFPRSLSPSGFVISLAHEGGTVQTLTATPTGSNACGMFGATTGDTFCMQMACPASGIYTLTVRAVVGQRQSEASTALTLA